MLTLIEAAKLMQGEDFRRRVIEVFARSVDILQALPFIDIQGNAFSWNREGELPAVAHRAVNAGYTASAGKVTKVTESLTIIGGDLDVDQFIIQTGGAQVEAAHLAMKLKALAQSIAYTIIKGDSASNPLQFSGLQVRSGNSPATAGQTLANGSTSGGDALSLVKLDAAIGLVDSPTHLLMSQAMKRRLSAAARLATVGGHIEYTKDSFGTPVMKYAGLPILVADQNGNTQAGLAFNEAAAGGGSTATSIYVASIGATGLIGFQSGPPQVRRLGETDDAPVSRTRVEWYAGIADQHSRCIARLSSISDAAVVA